MHLVALEPSPPVLPCPRVPSAIDHGAGEAVSSRRWMGLAVLCVSLLIVSLDGTVLNVALPTLVRKVAVHAGLILA